MKYLQIGFLKIILYSILFFFPLLCSAQNEKIKHADSLFKAKQYTQSLELYQSVFNDKKYTPAMFLRMAYINEGLGKIGATLFFLKLYHLASDDEQALKKTEELASKFKLTGYEEDDSSRLKRWFTNYTGMIQFILTLALFSISMAIFYQKSQNKKSWGLLVPFILLTGILMYVTNISSSESVIVIGNKTYLMDGPSAGANVTSVIDEGTLLKVVGREDVWLCVKWIDKEVYLKEKSVMKVAL